MRTSAPKGALAPAVSLAGVVLALASGAAAAEPRGTEARRLLAQRDRVAEATVTLPERSCAGALAGARNRIVTAAHCVSLGATQVDVATRDGEVQSASILHLDRERDLAVLGLHKQLSAAPLALGPDLPRAGARLLFVGRVDRASQTQVVRVDRLDRCPSLPDVSQALFTSVRAKPGDSGAPLVELANGGPRIVGVIHGGSRCHIAAPTAPLAALELPAAPSPSDATPARPPWPLGGKRLGPFVFERTPDGFRFSFEFKVDWRSDH